MKKWLPLLLVTGALSAAVEDNARLFSAKAVAAANEQLNKVRTATGKEILILTVNDLGGKKIVDFARNEGRARQLNGLVVLISKNPRQLEVMAGRKTTLVFRKEHRDLVVDIFSKNLRKAPDVALANAVKVITDTFNAANSALIQPDSQRPPVPVPVRKESSSFGWVKWLIIIGVIFLLIRLISYFMNRNAASTAVPGAGMPGQSGFGGGGFFASLMGGIFGAVAGNWIYDKFFGDSHDHSNYNQDSYRDSSQDWRNDDKGDFDSGSGSGGDWGSGDDSSGGGDSGGVGGDSW